MTPLRKTQKQLFDEWVRYPCNETNIVRRIINRGDLGFGYSLRSLGRASKIRKNYWRDAIQMHPVPPEFWMRFCTHFDLDPVEIIKYWPQE